MLVVVGGAFGVAVFSSCGKTSKFQAGSRGGASVRAMGLDCRSSLFSREFDASMASFTLGQEKLFEAWLPLQTTVGTKVG